MKFKINKSGLKLSFAIIVVFNLVGCDAINKPTNTSEKPVVSTDTNKVSAEKTTTTESTNQTQTGAKTATGLCQNKYYPVFDGNVRRYKVTATNSKNDNYTYTQSYQAGADKFTDVQNFSGGDTPFELKVDWSCLPDGLRTATFGQLNMMQKVGMTLDSNEAAGLTLPKDTDWAVGKKWTSAYNLGGNFEMKGLAKGAIGGKVMLDHEIVSIDEKVSVSGKDYTTAKVVSKMKMNVTFQNKSLPAESLTMTAWYVPEIGLVKHDVKSTLGSTVMELQAK